jgi:(1->4)-alpha-D-glucan 1-alpha-D-glucosylmutase
VAEPSALPLRASYRLQLRPGFGFDAAAALVPQIAAYGVSHLYLSPILEAALGSTHGYDTVDPTAVREELGGRAGLERLVAAARAHGIGILIDIVANHMSIADTRNRWWWDVLENGPGARSAALFDVDWSPSDPHLQSIVLAPILRDHRVRVLARREIVVERNGAAFAVRYGSQRLPVAPRAIGTILQMANQRAPAERLAFLADAHSELPLASTLEPATVERRHRDQSVLSTLLDELIARDPMAARAIDEAIAALNVDEGAMDAFLDRQNYRLAHWRSADHELDYRRFFDINTLVGLRVEDERVFLATHGFIAELCEAGLVDGVRVDHVDGLADPETYLARLRALIGPRPIYVEKILGRGEPLRDWPIEGTTGYDFLNQLTGLYLDPAADAPLGALAAELTGETRSFAVLASEARRQVLDDALDAEMRRLATLATSLRERHREARDITRRDLRAALHALVASFPIYRSYVVAGRGMDAADRDAISAAAEEARRLEPEVEPMVFDFLLDVLTLRRHGEVEAELLRRFQQLTSPAMAKGVEDTAFYRDPRLLALDEVGGDPRGFALSLTHFHEDCAEAARRWPERLLATSTQDTKRSEDARARLVALTHDVGGFALVAREFFDRAEGHRRAGAPDLVTMMIALQSLIAAWPLDVVRFGDFLRKAAREAKRRTSWTRQDTIYERGLASFAETILRDGRLVEPIAAYVARIDGAARAISLGWTLLKITCPGVPDFYQGSERWLHSLVDPDNRRPPDWEAAAALEARLERSSALPALRDDHAGLAKLHLIRRALAHRRDHAACFARGAAYEPLHVDDTVVGFLRRAPRAGTSIVLAHLRPMARPPARELGLPRGRFVDVLSPGPARVHQGRVTLAELLAGQPIALLHAEEVG